YDLVTGRGSPVANQVVADLVKFTTGQPFTPSSTKTTSTSGTTTKLSTRKVLVSAPIQNAADLQVLGGLASLTPPTRPGPVFVTSEIPVGVPVAVPTVTILVPPARPAETQVENVMGGGTPR